MNITELFNSGANITLAVTLSDLKAFHKEVIADTKRELEEIVISEKVETYPSPKQVCDILNVDLSTLWRWAKKGYLAPIEVGGKRRYRMSDVKAILNGGRNLK